MRILFLMDSPEYLRFYDSAIEAFVARGHSVALAVNSGRARKPVGLEGLHAYEGRLAVLGVVPEYEGSWGAVARGLRATMDFVRFLHPTFAAAPALRARIKRKVLPRAYHWLDTIPRLSARAVFLIERALMAAERAIPVYEPIAAYLRDQAPDVLLVSPLVAAASPQVDWIKAAKACGIRTAVCIASWDNLTNKGLLRIEPDRVVVWNEAQKREAVAYHYIPAEKVVVTGAQLFDRWFETGVTREREAFCRHVGLPDSGPFVLFTGSSGFISDSDAEVAFVRRWIDALRSSGDEMLRTMNVLVRPHPYNCARWEEAPLLGVPRVAVYPARRYNPVAPETRADYFDSLYHAAAVVGINTSAMLEAAIVGRPVCTVRSAEFAQTQEGTIHFRHLLPEQGGFVNLAESMDDHLRQLADCIRQPERTRAQTSRFVASFIRPHGIARPATPFFVDAIEQLGAEPEPGPERAPAWRHVVRPVLLAAAMPAVLVNGLTKLPTLERQRKRIAGFVRRSPKRLAGRVTLWSVLAYAYALLLSLSLGYFMLGSPLQVSEAVRNMMAVQRMGLAELVAAYSRDQGYLRPLLLAQLDVAFDLSKGHYFEMFKAIHVGQVLLAAVLFVALLPVRKASGALGAMFGVAALFGSHTFAGTVTEGFPINTFLTIVVCCLMAANLARGTPALWRDAAAVLLLVFAAFSVETGLLVWVLLVAARLSGWRGVSRGGLLVSTLVVAAYVVLRLVVFHIGTPALTERSSGFGFRVLDPPELVSRFGDRPWLFYAYNVASQVLTVLLGEPKAGVWQFARAISTGDVLPRDVIGVAACSGATVLLAWFIATRLRRWKRGNVSPAERWLPVAAAMIGANGLMSFPYTKNVVMSPAGVFFALAAAVAFAGALERLGARPFRASTALAAVVLAVLSGIWTARLVGIHYNLREKAFITRNDWAEIPVGTEPLAADFSRYPEAAALIDQLRYEALSMRVSNPAFRNPRAWRYFEEAW